MKGNKISTMPSRNLKFLNPSKDQLEIFHELLLITKPYSKLCEVRTNTSTRYELWTRHAFRTKSFHPKTEKGILFIGIAVCRTHVGLYFFPLHINVDLKKLIQNELLLLLKGGSCFHVKKISTDLLKQFEELFIIGWKDFDEKGLIGL